MGASPYIIHRDEAVFGPEPGKFLPERWIPGEGGVDVTTTSIKRMERYGMWWGYGDRECAGKYYAEMEMQNYLLNCFGALKFNQFVSLVDHALNIGVGQLACFGGRSFYFLDGKRQY